MMETTKEIPKCPKYKHHSPGPERSSSARKYIIVRAVGMDAKKMKPMFSMLVHRSEMFLFLSWLRDREPDTTCKDKQESNFYKTCFCKSETGLQMPDKMFHIFVAWKIRQSKLEGVKHSQSKLKRGKHNTKTIVFWGDWNLSELEFVRIHFNSKLEFARIGICQNWNLSELEFVRIGICQNWNLSELEFVRIGICQNWNLSELANISFGAKNAMESWLDASA